MIPHYQKCFRKCLFWATRFLLDITCLVPVYPPGCALPCYRGIIRNRFTLYTGHLVPEPNRILFHTVTFFNFVLYGLPVLRSAERALASARCWTIETYVIAIVQEASARSARSTEQASGLLFLQIWYNVEHKIFMIQKWMKVKCIYVP